MDTSPGKPKSRLVLGLAILGALLLALLVIAGVVYFRYRQTARIALDPSATQVLVSEPFDQSVHPAGQSISVQVDSVGALPFTSIELWINGRLDGVAAVPVAGQTRLSTPFSWTPPDGGNYALVGRAVNSAGGSAFSPAVIVFITPPDYPPGADTEAGKSQPAVYPAAPPAGGGGGGGSGGGGGGGAEPPDGEEVQPAEPWNNTPCDWLGGLGEDSPPAAPVISAAVDHCEAVVSIHDLSENEQGFAVYRQTAGDPAWVHAADLAPSAGQGWLEFRESGLSGGVTYYVAAFNSQGPANSNLALVNLDPQTCQEGEAPKRAILKLQVENLQLGGAGQLYCYNSLDAGHWERWPQAGFITSTANEETLQLLPPLLLEDVSGDGAASQGLKLKLECWAWEGGILRRLGSLVEQIDPEVPQRIQAAFDGVRFDITSGGPGDVGRETMELKPGMPFKGLARDPFAIETLGYVPTSDQMPYIVAWVSDNPADCMNAIEGEFEKEVECFEMPGFNEGPGGLNPQRYLIWRVADGTCQAEGIKDCHSLGWWEAFAKSNPDPHEPGVQFYLDYTLFNNGQAQGGIGWPVPVTQQAHRLLPDFPPAGNELCANGFQYVEVVMDVNSSAGEIIGPRSNMVAAPCPVALGNSIQVEVTYWAIVFENTDDGLNADTTSDDISDYIHGWFAAEPVGHPQKLRIGPMETVGQCENYDVIVTLDEDKPQFCVSEGDGAVELYHTFLCPYEPYDCEYDWKYGWNNNKMLLTLHDGEALHLWTHLEEWDAASPNDTICDADAWVGPRSIEEWATALNESVWYGMEDNGDASCSIQVILNALPPSP